MVRSGREQDQNKCILCSCYSLITISLKNYSNSGLFMFIFFLGLFIEMIECIVFSILFNFTILYWFCHISKWICHRYTCVPHPECSALLPPHTIPLGHPSAPAPSIQYRASNLDWWLISYMILYISNSIKQIVTGSASICLPKRHLWWLSCIHLPW